MVNHSSSSNFMFTPPQLEYIKRKLQNLVEAKLSFRNDPKELLTSAISMSYLDGQLACISELVKAHEATLASISSN